VETAAKGSKEAWDGYAAAVRGYEECVAHFGAFPDATRTDLSALFEDVWKAEARAVAAHRRLFGGPTLGETLAAACERVALPWPRRRGDEAEARWMEGLLALAPLADNEYAREMLLDARTLAHADLLFSTERLLRCFKALVGISGAAL